MRFPAVVAVLALTLAACGAPADNGDDVATGGGRSPSASASASLKAGSEKDALLAYSKCMRENGVPDFPDPKIEEGGGVGLSMPKGADPEKADAANLKCKKVLPNGGEPVKADPKVVEAQRKLAKCMRENGLPDFPDPDENGSTQIQGSHDLDPTSAKFKAAEKACAKYRPEGDDGGRLTTREEG
ncbi:hypothetical protein [Actinocorallia longicatena]|uniref:Secreted protein n=1 Tax=Actinocorallia longicatena TaxID=111803 RepID=A0ABP6QCH7_9ACTN